MHPIPVRDLELEAPAPGEFDPKWVLDSPFVSYVTTGVSLCPVLKPSSCNPRCQWRVLRHSRSRRSGSCSISAPTLEVEMAERTSWVDEVIPWLDGKDGEWRTPVARKGHHLGHCYVRTDVLRLALAPRGRRSALTGVVVQHWN